MRLPRGRRELSRPGPVHARLGAAASGPAAPLPSRRTGRCSPDGMSTRRRDAGSATGFAAPAKDGRRPTWRAFRAAPASTSWARRCGTIRPDGCEDARDGNRAADSHAARGFERPRVHLHRPVQRRDRQPEDGRAAVHSEGMREVSPVGGKAATSARRSMRSSARTRRCSWPRACGTTDPRWPRR